MPIRRTRNLNPDAILAAVAMPTPQRILHIADAIRHGISLERIHDTCKYDPWFLERIKNIVDAEKGITARGCWLTARAGCDLKNLDFRMHVLLR